MRARGLKLQKLYDYESTNMSRPVRARGLKHGNVARGAILRQSRPVRARGLKQHTVGIIVNTRLVAPRAGAWLETE